jgi:hypothetical protein
MHGILCPLGRLPVPIGSLFYNCGNSTLCDGFGRLDSTSYFLYVEDELFTPPIHISPQTWRHR